MFVHHEITLTAFPLCLKWLSMDVFGGDSGNIGIVGTFKPEIEIWDLDIVNTLEPKSILGNPAPISKKKKKSSGSKAQISHSDAVVSLDINKKRPNLLVSGSADKSIILWDLSESKGCHQYKFMGERINSLEWHPNEEPICLASSLSGIKIFDSRNPESMVLD